MAAVGRFKSAIVIFDTRYGNTEKIARSLEIGLKLAGLETNCINAKDVSSESLKEYDVIAVGAPTEKIRASESIKQFLEKVKKDAPYLNGKAAFAFDTKLPYPLTGSAAKFIASELRKMGLNLVAPRESAYVYYPKGGKDSDVKIKDGEENRFQEIGKRVGSAFFNGLREEK